MFTIVTYIHGNYAPCLRWSIGSWLQNAKADKIVVYSDQPGGVQGLPSQIEQRCIHDTRSDDPLTAWDRKIDITRHYAGSMSTEECVAGGRFIWIDADCWVTKPLSPLWESFGPARVAATRLVGRCIRGQAVANAGVIPFQCPPKQFFDDWQARSKKIKGSGPITKENKWHEQKGFCYTVLDAFDGLKPYTATIISEKRWNCEEDNKERWMLDLRKYKPAILHFKNSWWKDAALVKRALEAVK